MSLYLFWTDGIIWTLVIAVLLTAQLLGRSAQFRTQWRSIFDSRVATVSGVILAAYLLIALVDSVHFSRDGQIFSLLDILFNHLGDQMERTYSAPFARVEYVKSMQMLESGVRYDYQPLQHVDMQGPYLLLSLLKAVGVTGALFALLYGARRLLGKTTHPSTALLTAAVLVLIFAALYFLSHHVHVLGTDKIGQDVLYAGLKSIRTGIMIGTLTTIVMLPLSVLLGISAGLFRGWIDDVVQYLYTTLNSIPGVLLIAAGILVMQSQLDHHPEWFSSTEERADLRLMLLILILGLTSWTGLCRLLRAETLKIRQLEFVTAARALGVGWFTVLRRHILPNVAHIILIAIVLDFSALVLAEAVLSYVGVGVDPTTFSWGNMIDQARLEMAREPIVWWSLASAFLFMFVLVLSANLFSDRVQYVLNPRNRK